eukprot:612613-Hanusia_phi.AAC.4
MGSGVRLIKHFQPGNNIMKNFIIRSQKCIGCNKHVTSSSAQADKPPRILCSDCEVDKDDHILAAQASVIETQHARAALWKLCKQCTRVNVEVAKCLGFDDVCFQVDNTNLSQMCSNVICQTFYARSAADKGNARACLPTCSAGAEAR